MILLPKTISASHSVTHLPPVQMWIEVAETESGQLPLVWTENEKVFTMYLPPNVSSIDFVSGPYTGSTKFLVSGAGFQSFTGLSCALLWCREGSTSSSDCFQVLARARFVSSTEVECVTNSYDPMDAACSSEVCPFV